VDLESKIDGLCGEDGGNKRTRNNQSNEESPTPRCRLTIASRLIASHSATPFALFFGKMSRLIGSAHWRRSIELSCQRGMIPALCDRPVHWRGNRQANRSGKRVGEVIDQQLEVVSE